MPQVDQPLVYVIILNWNGWRDTIPCLQSLSRLTYPNCRIAIVDNASTDNSEERIRAACPDVTLIRNGANLGFSGGNNVGIYHALDADADYVWLLNNDTLVDPDALGALVRHAEADPRVGLVGSKIVYASQPDRVWFAGGAVRLSDGTAGAMLIDVPDDDQLPPAHETMFLSGCSVLARCQMIKQIGGLEEAYFLYYEDVDWSFVARNHGWKVMYEPLSVVYHKVSASVGTLSPIQTFHSARSRTIFVKRHLSRSALLRSLWLSAKSYGLRHLAHLRWSAGIAGFRGLLSGITGSLREPGLHMTDRPGRTAQMAASPAQPASHARTPGSRDPYI